MKFDKKVLSLIEKVNKNYRLPFERLYGRRTLENHEYRKYFTLSEEKSPSMPNLTLPPTYLEQRHLSGVEDFR